MLALKKVGILCAIVFIFVFPISANRVSIAIFPLQYQTQSDYQSWTGHGLVDLLYRNFNKNNKYQVWDPIFLCRADSLNLKVHTDSTVKLHHTRWMWDIALLGNYSCQKDSVFFDLIAYYYPNKQNLSKIEIKEAGYISDYYKICLNIYKRVIQITELKSSIDTTQNFKVPQVKFASFKTYAHGYGYELFSENALALSSYSRSIEIDPKFGQAYFRRGCIFKNDGDYIHAKDDFQKSILLTHKDPSYIASMGDFLSDFATPNEVIKFVDENRTTLMKTSSGMKAIGKMYLTSGEYQRAIAVLTQAVASGYTDLDATFYLGNAYLAAGEYALASDLFNQLVLIRPNYLRYYSSLAAAFRQSGKLMEATMILEAALKIDPSNVTTLIDLSHTYFLLSWTDRAEQLLLRAIEIDPKVFDSYVNLGVIYWHQNRKDDARRAFQKALDNVTTKQGAFINMGTIYLLQGKRGKALANYLKAKKLGRTNEVLIYNLAKLFLAEKNYKKANFYFDELLKLSPGRLDILIEQAKIAEQMKKIDLAENYYQKILELSPYNETALKGLIAILVQKQKFEDALKPVETFLARIPGNREFMLLNADLYYKMEWYEVAIMKYEFFLRDYPNDYAGYFGIGKSLYQLMKQKGTKRADEALRAFKEAGFRNTKNPEIDYFMGNIYYEFKDDLQTANSYWQNALSKAQSQSLKKEIKSRLKLVQVSQ